jgi:hypothetical protein
MTYFLGLFYGIDLFFFLAYFEGLRPKYSQKKKKKKKRKKKKHALNKA